MTIVTITRLAGVAQEGNLKDHIHIRCASRTCERGRPFKHGKYHQFPQQIAKCVRHENRRIIGGVLFM